VRAFALRRSRTAAEHGESKSTLGVLKGFSRGTRGVLYTVVPPPSMASSLGFRPPLLISNKRHLLYKITAATIAKKHPKKPPTMPGMEMPPESGAGPHWKKRERERARERERERERERGRKRRAHNTPAQTHKRSQRGEGSARKTTRSHTKHHRLSGPARTNTAAFGTLRALATSHGVTTGTQGCSHAPYRRWKELPWSASELA
jgi:hypothetical protein